MPFRSIYIKLSLFLLLAFATQTSIYSQCDDNTAVTFTIEEALAINGEEICLDVTVENFVDINSFLIPFSFDPNVLQYVRCEPNPVFMYDCEGSNPPNKLAAGIIQLFWNFTGSEPPQTLTDGDTFITFCFEVVGNVGDNTSIITGSVPPLGGAPGVDIEVFRGTCGVPLPIDNRDGTITVGCVSPELVPNTCPTPGNTDSGSVRFSVCGGTAPYTYDLDGNFSGTVDNDLEEVIIDNLPAGDYTLNIYDNQGIQLLFANNTFTVQTGEPLQITGVDQAGPSCASVTNLNGFIEVSTTGGMGDISYKWSSTSVNVNPLMNLPVGSYAVTVTDENGCQDVMEDIEIEYNNITLDVSTTDAACENMGGNISVTASGGDPRIRNGVPEYRYIINGENGRNLDALFLSNVTPNEPITITVEDFSVSNPKCSVDTTLTLVALKSMSVTVNSGSNGCGSGGNILASTLANTGTLSATITYEVLDAAGNIVQTQSIPSADEANFIGVVPGVYTVIARDDFDNCSIESIPLTITPGNGEGLTINNVTMNPGCDGNAEGSIELIVTGGDGNYEYVWSDDAAVNSEIRSQLSPGMYTVVVTDGTGCSGTDAVTISSSDSEILLTEPNARVTVQAPICPGVSDGAISITMFDPANANFSMGRWKYHF